MEDKKDLFATLSAIDCTGRVEKKGRFNYLSWAWAWSILKKHCPEARYQKHTFVVDGLEVPYMINREGNAWVKVTVFTNDDTQTEVFPILDHLNKAVKNPTSWDVNVSLQRCMVKAIAMLGLGLYIYAGEDLPETDSPYTEEEERELYEKHGNPPTNNQDDDLMGALT